MPTESKVPNIPDHELSRPIGRGSYGEVWLARNALGSWRAVKVVHRAAFDRERPYEREFLGIQRYEPISRSHEGLVQVLHAGRNDAEGFFYYAMELADPLGGEDGTSATLIDQATYEPATLRGALTGGKRLPIKTCIVIGRHLAGGLAHLHANGLVHRDIKPSNIVFIAGKAKLADLGLVSGISESRSYVGTEGFVPPEGPGTVAADLFALGMVLYQAATGLSHDDFPNFPAEWLRGEFPAAAVEFHEIILRACESDPQRRYRSAAEMDRDLALLEQGISLRHLRRIERRLSWLRRAAIAGGVAAVLATGGLAFAGWRVRVNHDYFQRSERLRQRAEAAEKATRDEFYDLLVTRARAEMLSGRPGQRAKALAAITEAAAIRPGDATLRDLAITALALPDAEVITNMPVLSGFAVPPGGSVAIDSDCRNFAFADSRAIIHLRGIPSGQEWATVSGTLMGYFSPDGGRLAVYSKAGEWGVEEPATGDRWKVPAYARKGSAPAFHADGHSVYVWDGPRLRLFDYESGDITGEFPGGFPPSRYDYSLDGKTLLASDAQHRRLVVVNEQGTEIRMVAWPAEVSLWELSMSPDGEWFAASFADFSVHVWRTRGGGEWVITSHRAEVPAFGWDMAHQRLITSSWDGTTRWWNLASRQAELFEGAWGNPIAVSLDGTRVARYGRFGGDQLGMVVQRIVGGGIFRFLGEPLPEGNADQRKGPWAISFSPDGRYCAMGSFDGARIWTTEPWQEVAYLPIKRVFSVNWLGETNRLTTSGDDGIRTWALVNSANGLLPRLASTTSTNAAIQRLAGIPGGERYAVLNGEVRAFGDAGSRLVATGATDNLALSPDGRLLVAMGRHGGDVALLEAAKGSLIRRIPASVPEGAAFSLDSATLYLSAAGELVAVRIADGSQAWRLPRPESAGGGALRLNGNGRILAASMGPQSVALVRCADGMILATLAVPTPEQFSALDFSPDGRFLAGATTSHVSQVWDLRELRQELRKLGLDWKE